VEQTGTSLRAEIKEALGETRPKCIPAKAPELEVALLTGPIRWLKGRASPRWLRTVLKREASIRKREVEVIVLTRPADNSKARKSQANRDAVHSPLEAAILFRHQSL
jgi:hypothetical protein